MSKKDSNVPIIGGVIAAVGAGLCCAVPFVLLLLGISGSWIVNLTLLEPYRPIFILLVIVLFGFALIKTLFVGHIYPFHTIYNDPWVVGVGLCNGFACAKSNAWQHR